MMKKIALVTWFHSINYGTCLQCVTLAHFLNKKGYTVFVPANLSYFTLNDPVDFFRRFRKKIAVKFHPPYQAVKENELPEEIRRGYEIRKQNVDNVISQELKIYPIKNNRSFVALNKDVDVLLTGSDQIWNPNHTTSALMLSFAEPEKRKIAYASSIGVSEIPVKMRSFYRRYLSRFDAIGVREESAVRVLKEIGISVPMKQVLDPTLLLTKQDLIELSQKADLKLLSIPQKYVFCYFIGDKMDWTEDVKKFAAEKKLEIVICLSESNVVPCFGTICAEAGPYEFLALIHNAAFVVTDSFHASAIAINLQKEFFVYKRFDDSDIKSQNSRLEDLLKDLELSDRLQTKGQSLLQSAAHPIDTVRVAEILEEKRSMSQMFLIQSIEGTGYGNM